jgi:hypothetical protein
MSSAADLEDMSTNTLCGGNSVHCLKSGKTLGVRSFYTPSYYSIIMFFFTLYPTVSKMPKLFSVFRISRVVIVRAPLKLSFFLLFYSLTGISTTYNHTVTILFLHSQLLHIKSRIKTES